MMWVFVLLHVSVASNREISKRPFLSEYVTVNGTLCFQAIPKLLWSETARQIDDMLSPIWVQKVTIAFTNTNKVLRAQAWLSLPKSF